MKKHLLITPLVVLSVLFFLTAMASCSNDGADGAQGIEGPQGAEGPAGPKGDDGSSNVIYSEWLDVAFKADTMHLSGGGIDTIGFYAKINVPKLTKELLSTADVKTYINSKTTADPVIYSLPYRSDNGLYIDVYSRTESIEIYSNADISTVVTNKGEKIQQYRYMIVPGSIKAKSHSVTNWSDYNQVKKHLGLKD